MPIYEYLCGICGHSLERLQKISEMPLVDCPECGKPSLKKKISAAGFQLKGSGWYVTDFKNKGEKKSEKSSESSKTEKPETAKASTENAAKEITTKEKVDKPTTE